MANTCCFLSKTKKKKNHVKNTGQPDPTHNPIDPPVLPCLYAVTPTIEFTSFSVASKLDVWHAAIAMARA